MIAALSRQSDLNTYYVHLLHNLAVEMTKLNLEVQDLKNRNLQLQGRLELRRGARRRSRRWSCTARTRRRSRAGRRRRGRRGTSPGLKLAFVVQRYGLDIAGGAEYHCRLVAEHMARHAQVEVITTCAADYITWANHYPEGREVLNGIPVRRFKVKRPRDPERFADWTDRGLPRSSHDPARRAALAGGGGAVLAAAGAPHRAPPRRPRLSSSSPTGTTRPTTACAPCGQGAAGAHVRGGRRLPAVRSSRRSSACRAPSSTTASRSGR